MPILCFSTKISPAKTVAEIQRRLTDHGASRVLIENEDFRPAAVAFMVRGPRGEEPYRLPARTEGVLVALERERGRGRVSRAQATREHAERAAWRITLEWVKVQLAVIESGLVTLDEVMLPYRQIAGGQTVYEAVSSGRLALPGPGPG